MVTSGTQVKVVINKSTQKISNPLSAKDCGDWRVTSYNMIGGKEWLVDAASASSIALKFTAKPGTIFSGTVTIKDSLKTITSND